MPDTNPPRVTMADEDLAAKLFGGGADRKPPTPGWSCPKAEVIAAYLDGTLDDVTRVQLESHQSNCERCRTVIGDVIRIQRETHIPAPSALVHRAIALVPPTSRQPRWIFAPVAAAGGVACIVITALLLRTPEHLALPIPPTPAAPIVAKAGPWPKVSTKETARKPTVTQLLPTVISPREDSVLSRRSVAFRWKTVPQARFYQVQVVTSEGEPVWEGRSTGANLPLPADLVLQDGKYFVWISVMMENGRVEKSDPVGFRIASSR